eukprot:359199-Chlamydomonas_euryale.AAC.3
MGRGRAAAPSRHPTALWMPAPRANTWRDGCGRQPPGAAALQLLLGAQMRTRRVASTWRTAA